MLRQDCHSVQNEPVLHELLCVLLYVQWCSFVFWSRIIRCKRCIIGTWYPGCNTNTHSSWSFQGDCWGNAQHNWPRSTISHVGKVRLGHEDAASVFRLTAFQCWHRERKRDRCQAKHPPYTQPATRPRLHRSHGCFFVYVFDEIFVCSTFPLFSCLNTFVCST